jgi:hypothetical protein
VMSWDKVVPVIKRKTFAANSERTIFFIPKDSRNIKACLTQNEKIVIFAT